MKYSGRNLSNKRGISQRTCALLCFRKSACTHWTYNRKHQGGKCWLKSSNRGRARSTNGSNSGQKACGGKDFSLSTVTSEAAAAMEECREPWTQLSTGCYLFRDRNSTWYEAKQECKQSGGHLAEIETQEEQDALEAEIESKGWDNSIIYGFWIGLTDVFHDGTWVWDHSGQPMEFSAWAGGEPNNLKGAQHCAALTLGWAKKKWDDTGCEAVKLPYAAICEAPSKLFLSNEHLDASGCDS